MEIGAVNRTPLSNVFFFFGAALGAWGVLTLLFRLILGVFGEDVGWIWVLVAAGHYFAPAAFFWLVSYRRERHRVASSSRREIGYPGAIVLAITVCMAWFGGFWFLFAFLAALWP